MAANTLGPGSQVEEREPGGGYTRELSSCGGRRVLLMVQCEVW